MKELKEQSKGDMRQYRTYELVRPKTRTIKILGYTGGDYALTAKMRTALRWAVDNYNAAGMTLNFTYSYGTDIGAADIVVYKVNNGLAGGKAGFPSGFDPYKWVQIYNGLENYSTNVNEHVISHEIGHCLGLRHTDYATRASCGQSGEAAGYEGAVHIPGTPTGIDWNSLMLACFDSNENGELGTYDKTALQYLY